MQVNAHPLCKPKARAHFTKHSALFFTKTARLKLEAGIGQIVIWPPARPKAECSLLLEDPVGSILPHSPETSDLVLSLPNHLIA